MEHMKGSYSEGVEKVKTKNYKGKNQLEVTFEKNLR